MVSPLIAQTSGKPASPPASAPSLPPHIEQAKTLAGGEVHRYAIAPDAGRWLRVSVIQEGIDVALTLVGTPTWLPLTVDSPNGRWGVESLLLRVPQGETVELEVRSLSVLSAAGRYRLRLDAMPAGGEHALRRIVAERDMTEAARSFFEGTKDSIETALSRYRDALDHWLALADHQQSARTLSHIARLEAYQGDRKKALASHRQALEWWKKLGDRRNQARSLNEIGALCQALGDGTDVFEIQRQALSLWRVLGDLDGRARTLNFLGLAWARKDPREALEPYRQALDLFRRLGELEQQGIVLNNLGGAYDLLSEPQDALDHYRQALAIHQERSDRRNQAAVWNNMASIFRRTGHFQEALDHYSQSLAARRDLGDRRGEARVLNNLGITYLRLGDTTRAEAHLQDALRLRRATQDGRGEAVTLSNLGRVLLVGFERPTEAFGYFDQALSLYRTAGDDKGQATVHLEMARVAADLGRLDLAHLHLERCLTGVEKLGNPWRKAMALTTLGLVSVQEGDFLPARDALHDALEIFRAAGDQLGASDALAMLAEAERGLANAAPPGPVAMTHREVALRHAMSALELLDPLRSDMHSLDLRASFLAGHQSAFELAIDLAMDLHFLAPDAGHTALALELSERSRSRSLLDRLNESGLGRRDTLDPDLSARQRKLLDRLSVMVDRQRRLLGRRGPDEHTAPLAAEIQRLLADIEAVENEIRQRSPARNALAHPEPLAASAIRALLDPDTLLLEVALGETRSFLWVVSREGVEGHPLPPRRTIEAAAREFYEAVRFNDPRSSEVALEAAAVLSEMLFSSVAGRLTQQRLAIVADGALHYIPFAALPHPAWLTTDRGAGRHPFLIEQHEIVILPSASILGVQRQLRADDQAPTGELAILADPVFGDEDPRLASGEPESGRLVRGGANPVREGLERLAWSRWEAEALMAHAGESETFLALGFDANLKTVQQGSLRGHRIVHFATHGIVDDEHPELSALVLSLRDAQGRPRRGHLRLPEIYNLDLRAELVVLSGCRTALGSEVRGEGLVGLSRGFFAAGARRLVASLWRVQDRGAAELMNRFYLHLFQGNEERRNRPAAALRAAQLDLLQDPELSAPYHWAAFALYGDWR